MSGYVWFVGAGPGAPDLITLRGWKALQAADVVLIDSLVNPQLVEELDCEIIDVGKRCGAHAMAQEDINLLIASQARQGRKVVRLKGGDPSVFARLGEELLHLVGEGIPYEVIPGISSSTAAPLFAGIPVTHRGIADSFLVMTAHRKLDETDFSIPPFHPTTTLVLMMSVGTTSIWRDQLLEQGYPAEWPVAFVASGTTSSQRVLVTTVGRVVEDLEQSGLRPPALAVVGKVVELREKLCWFEPAALSQEEGELNPLEDPALISGLRF